MDVHRTKAGLMYVSNSYLSNKLLLLGSGLSANLGMYLWDELLEKAAKHLKVDCDDLKKSTSGIRSNSNGSYAIAYTVVEKCGSRARVQAALVRELRDKQDEILDKKREQVGMLSYSDCGSSRLSSPILLPLATRLFPSSKTKLSSRGASSLAYCVGLSIP